MTIEQPANQVNSVKFNLTTPQRKGSCDIPVCNPESLRRGIFQRCRKYICMTCSGGHPPDPLYCFYGSIKGIGYIVGNLKGVVIKEFVIKAPKLLPFLVLPKALSLHLVVAVTPIWPGSLPPQITKIYLKLRKYCLQKSSKSGLVQLLLLLQKIIRNGL